MNARRLLAASASLAACRLGAAARRRRSTPRAARCRSRDDPAAAAGQRGERRRPAAAQLRHAAADHSAPGRRLPDRPQLQQVPGLPRARQDGVLAAPFRSAPRTTSIASGKVLPQISTRRYFCMQCHVAQDRDAAAGRQLLRGRRAPARSRQRAPPGAMIRTPQALLEDHPPAERALQPGLSHPRRLHRRHHVLGRASTPRWS